MKKWLLAVFVLMLVPTIVVAAEFGTNEKNQTYSADKVIQDDLYIAADTVKVSSTINGDLIIAGGTIRIDGKISGDVLGAGGEINFDGEAGDDVRVAGGVVDISGKINGDLFIAGGSLNIAKEAVITGQVYIGGGEVVIAGHSGAVKAGVGTLKITETAVINGDLAYQSNSNATIDPSAQISGKVRFNQIKNNSTVFGLGSFVGFLWWISSFILAGLFMVLAPRKTETLVTNWRTNFWVNLLTGFLFLVAAPVAAFALLFTIVGIPVGVGLVLVIPFFLFVAKLVSILVLGCWIQRVWDKTTPNKPTWLAALAGAILLTILVIIPFLGWLVVFVVLLTSLGALLRFDWQLLKKLRSSGDL